MAVADGNETIYNIDIETKKTTTLKVTDDMIQQEILDDIENAKKKLIECGEKTARYHDLHNPRLDYEKLSFQSFGDYENEIDMETEKTLKLNYIMSPEYSIFHIFGFLQSVFGKITAIWIYLKLKYDFNVIHNLKCKLNIDSNISHLVISTGHDTYLFTEMLYNLHELFGWKDHCARKWSILEHLPKEERIDISKRYYRFTMFIQKDNYDDRYPILDLLEKHPEYVYYRQIQEVELKLSYYFNSLGNLMERFPDDYIRIVERIKKQYDQKTCDLRDKYSPLSRMGPASSSSKRQRED